MPVSYQQIVGKLLVTAYLGTKNSSSLTRERASRVAKGLGALHFELEID